MNACIWSVGSAGAALLALTAHLPVSVWLAIGAFGAIWSGVVAGEVWWTCILYCLPAFAVPPGMFYAMVWMGGATPLRLLPVLALLGAAPGLGAMLFLSRALDRYELPEDSRNIKN